MIEKKSSKTILIVDDEKSLAKALSMKLNSSGFEVEILHDGTEVVEKLKSGKFDLLLLDLVMPQTNGFDVLEEMKKNDISVPVIALSNLSQEVDKQKAEELGVKDYFIKSNTSLKDVVGQVKKLL